ncbi:MAG: hypothetical protein RL885_00030 [Planctomycetota bacterium]
MTRKLSDAAITAETFTDAIADGQLERARDLLYREPLEEHPLLLAAPDHSRAQLLGRTNSQRDRWLEAEFPRLHERWAHAAILETLERIVVEDLIVEQYFLVKHPSLHWLEWRCVSLRRSDRGWGVDDVRRVLTETATAYFPVARDRMPRDWASRYRRTYSEDVEVRPDQEIIFETGDKAHLQWHPRDPRFEKYTQLSADAVAGLSEHTAVLEVSMILEHEFNARMEQLLRMSQAIFTFASAGWPVVYLPVSNLMHEASDVTRLLQDPSVDPDDLGTFWVNVEANDELAYTRGLSHLQLPEIEVPLGDRPDARFDLCAQTAVHLLREGWVLKLGDTVGSGPTPEWRVVRGRRGPTPEETYGAWGSIQLESLASPSRS